jgi:molybdate transport system regulatory protein
VLERSTQHGPSRGAQRSATNLFIRVDLAGGLRIGPGKIALLEAIRSTGSISAAARAIGMSYRWGWLLVEEINQGAKAPAVTAAPGGRRGGRAIVTPTGESIITCTTQSKRKRARPGAKRSKHSKCWGGPQSAQALRS